MKVEKNRYLWNVEKGKFVAAQEGEPVAAQDKVEMINSEGEGEKVSRETQDKVKTISSKEKGEMVHCRTHQIFCFYPHAKDFVSPFKFTRSICLPGLLFQNKGES